MGMLLIVVGAVSGALVGGALWGLFGRLRARVEGCVVGVAGGALLLSLVLELVQPAIGRSSMLVAVLGVSTGAGLFAIVDWLIDEKWGPQSGGGMLAAVTLDGIPENVALGIALIGAGLPEVAALAGSILLSNLPEAASGARLMREEGGLSKERVFTIWVATAFLLSLAAVAGNLLFAGLDERILAFVSCIAAGAVVASLTTEIMPQAHEKAPDLAGFATAIGLLVALLLHSLE